MDCLQQCTIGVLERESLSFTSMKGPAQTLLQTPLPEQGV